MGPAQCWATTGPFSTGPGTHEERRVRMQVRELERLTRIWYAGAAAVVLAACGGSSPSSSSGTATVPSGLSVKSFDSSFSGMSSLKSVTAAGKGLVGVILPDTTSSTRYINF